MNACSLNTDQTTSYCCQNGVLEVKQITCCSFSSFKIYPSLLPSFRHPFAVYGAQASIFHVIPRNVYQQREHDLVVFTISTCPPPTRSGNCAEPCFKVRPRRDTSTFPTLFFGPAIMVAATANAPLKARQSRQTRILTDGSSASAEAVGAGSHNSHACGAYRRSGWRADAGVAGQSVRLYITNMLKICLLYLTTIFWVGLGNECAIPYAHVCRPELGPNDAELRPASRGKFRRRILARRARGKQCRTGLDTVHDGRQRKTGRIGLGLSDDTSGRIYQNYVRFTESRRIFGLVGGRRGEERFVIVLEVYGMDVATGKLSLSIGAVSLTQIVSTRKPKGIVVERGVASLYSGVVSCQIQGETDEVRALLSERKMPALPDLGGGRVPAHGVRRARGAVGPWWVQICRRKE
ncbi:hypothetical protein C8R47DRAFT_1074411 [Mycena vitilis]|nr:hypothetical protein C8R47DRAFT_1074411 [Mycena vitilis]